MTCPFSLRNREISINFTLRKHNASGMEFALFPYWLFWAVENPTMEAKIRTENARSVEELDKMVLELAVDLSRAKK